MYRNFVSYSISHWLRIGDDVVCGEWYTYRSTKQIHCFVKIRLFRSKSIANISKIIFLIEPFLCMSMTKCYSLKERTNRFDKIISKLREENRVTFSLFKAKENTIKSILLVFTFPAKELIKTC